MGCRNPLLSRNDLMKICSLLNPLDPIIANRPQAIAVTKER